MIVFHNEALGQEEEDRRQSLNVTILGPGNGSIVTPESPWWSFGYGDKQFPVTIRIINNTSSSEVKVSLTLRDQGGAYLLTDPDEYIAKEDVPPGTAKDTVVQAVLGWAYKAGKGPQPVTLYASAIAGFGRGVGSTPVNFTLNA